MGEQPRTEYDQPIALRRNESARTEVSRETPNPWSRLEGCHAVARRLTELVRELEVHDQLPAPKPLRDVLQLLALDLAEAVNGQDVDVVRAVGAYRGVEHWVSMLWPAGE